jgi:hypothetical protein
MSQYVYTGAEHPYLELKRGESPTGPWPIVDTRTQRAAFFVHGKDIEKKKYYAAVVMAAMRNYNSLHLLDPLDHPFYDVDKDRIRKPNGWTIIHIKERDPQLRQLIANAILWQM